MLYNGKKKKKNHRIINFLNIYKMESYFKNRKVMN